VVSGIPFLVVAFGAARCVSTPSTLRSVGAVTSGGGLPWMICHSRAAARPLRQAPSPQASTAAM